MNDEELEKEREKNVLITKNKMIDEYGQKNMDYFEDIFGEYDCNHTVCRFCEDFGCHSILRTIKLSRESEREEIIKELKKMEIFIKDEEQIKDFNSTMKKVIEIIRGRK